MWLEDWVGSSCFLFARKVLMGMLSQRGGQHGFDLSAKVDPGF